jgi:dipeptidyl aminopeptidase/acylaminoacyl peptidase
MSSRRPVVWGCGVVLSAALAGCASSGPAPAKSPPGSVVGATEAIGADPLPPLIDRGLFFADPETSGGQISPDGKFLAFRRPYKGVLNLWVKGMDQPFSAARPVTAGSKQPVQESFWTEDSRYLVYTQDQIGDDSVHAFVVDPAAVAGDAGVPAARDLTPAGKVTAQILALPEATPGVMILAINDRDPAAADVYRIDIASGKRQLLVRNGDHVIAWNTDLSGKVRLGQRLTADGGREILRVDKNRLTQIYSCGPFETCQPLRFHKDGRRVYLITNKGRPDLSRLVLLDVATALDDVVETDPEQKVDFGSADFSDATEELVATNYDAERLRTYPRDPEYRRAVDLVRAKVQDGDIHFVSSSEDGRYLLASIVSDVDPGATYLYDRESGKVDLLYRPRPKLPTQNLSAARHVTYDARDGTPIEAYLTVPKGAGCHDMPAVVLPHGGPWARDTWGYNAWAQFLANRGYLVLQPNFRGSTGYGKKFVNIGNRQWGTGTMQTDVTDGGLWLVEQKFANPKRLAIVGASYGGFAALSGAAFASDVWAAAVDILGASSIPSLMAGIPAGMEPLRRLFSARVGDPVDPEQLSVMRAQSPLYAAKKIRTPLLMVQGRDAPTKQAEAEQIVATMRDGKQTVEYLLTDDQSQSARGQENRVATFAAVERFLAQHVGGRHQQDVPAPIAQRLAAITVDVRTLKAPTALAVAAVEPPRPTQQPNFTGAALRPATLRYATKGEVKGQPVEGTSTWTIASGTRARRPIWTIDEQSSTSVGAGKDTTVLDKKTLLPLGRTAQQGDAAVDLAFSGKEATGQLIRAGGQDQAVHASSDDGGNLLTDGMPLNLALATLPLKVGYVTQVRSLATTTGKAQLNFVVVKDLDSLETPAGKFDAFRILVGPADELSRPPPPGTNPLVGVMPPPGSSLVWIERAAPHRVVRWERILADGSISVELINGGGKPGNKSAGQIPTSMSRLRGGTRAALVAR